MSLRKWVFPVLAGLMALASTQSARAEFSITIVVDDSGYNTTFFDNDGVFDTNEDIGVIDLNTTLLNQSLTGTGFSFGGVEGSSNAPGMSGQALLTLSGTVFRDEAGTGTIRILTLENAFDLGTAPGILFSDASDTFANFSPGDQRTFQSTFEDSDSLVSTPVLTFAASRNSSGGNTAVVDLDGQFSLSNETVITLTGTGVANRRASDNFTGTTEVNAVPEPASLAMIALGGSALALRGFRRRKVTA